MTERWTIFGGILCAALVACGGGGESRGSFDDPNAAGAGDGTDDGSGSSDAPPSSTPPQPGKTGCAQTTYTETLPTKASLADLSFSSAAAEAYLVSALDRRYPVGKFVMQGGESSPLSAQQGSCVDRFLAAQDRGSAESVLRRAETVVHECGHFFDLGQSSGGNSTFVITPKAKFTCASGDTTSRGGKTFARSRLQKDAYASKRPACGGSVRAGCDFYADTYLDGNPDDTKFDSGDQGFDSVLEEATQYVNSLATSLAFQEAFASTKSSERDGILTFLWYIERYLKMAREEYPAAYTVLSGQECWRQAILTVWDRGWFYLDATKGLADTLGMDDAAIVPLVKDPTLTAEIDALRKLECK